jgi:hypothetical protein
MQRLAALRRGSPQSACAHLRESILFCPAKEKTIIFMIGRKESNNTVNTQDIAGCAGR